MANKLILDSNGNALVDNGNAISVDISNNCIYTTYKSTSQTRSIQIPNISQVPTRVVIMANNYSTTNSFNKIFYKTSESKYMMVSKTNNYYYGSVSFSVSNNTLTITINPSIENSYCYFQADNMEYSVFLIY